MRYLKVREEGEGYRAELAEAEPPRSRAGELLIRVAASGLNRADLAQISGRYPPPAGESEILGLEVSGTVEGTGQRVCALLAGGGHAEYVAVPEGQVFPLPRGLDLVAGAAIPEAYLTAYLNLAEEGGLKEGHTLLVHAGASGVGVAAIQVGKLLGARVAATTRTSAKIPAIEREAVDLAIDTSGVRFEEEIERVWGPGSVDLILDPIGAATLGGDLRILRLGGRIIFLSTLGGARPELDLAQLMKKRARLIGSTLRSRSRPEKAGIVHRFRGRILPAFEAGRLRPTIDAVYPPERAPEAFTRMRENRNVGKILIDWSRA